MHHASDCRGNAGPGGAGTLTEAGLSGCKLELEPQAEAGRGRAARLATVAPTAAAVAACTGPARGPPGRGGPVRGIWRRARPGAARRGPGGSHSSIPARGNHDPPVSDSESPAHRNCQATQARMVAARPRAARARRNGPAAAAAPGGPGQRPPSQTTTDQSTDESLPVAVGLQGPCFMPR